MVLEHAGDLTLEKFYKATEGKISLAHVKTITQQLLRALSFLHANKIVHRDIKPDNIMLRTQPELHVKLIDFNIAHDLN